MPDANLPAADFPAPSPSTVWDVAGGTPCQYRYATDVVWAVVGTFADPDTACRFAALLLLDCAGRAECGVRVSARAVTRP